MNYRIKPYDQVNDIWILQERFLRFFWRGTSAGPFAKIIAFYDAKCGRDAGQVMREKCGFPREY